jgi:membrane associated rhomboid family serine protease
MGGFTMPRMPAVILGFIIATIAASLVGTVGMRNGFPLVEWCVLFPERVLHGEAWRLVTWVFFEVQSPLGLVFACLSYYWFGTDLAIRWGTRRFIVYMLGIAALTGAVITALALVLPSIMMMPYVGAWPLGTAIIIIWATYYPMREIRFYFVLPLSGRGLILFTIGATVLWSLYAGLYAMLPEFIAEAIALLALRFPSPKTWWLEQKLKGMEKKRRASHLRAVPRDADRGDRRGGDDDDKPDPPAGRWLN